ncbi:tyrosine-protein phosphatase [Iodidimonas sp. SYSU 1G8]|uniref:tyrosine-protein phosphatase n=1 Tax=Iodidimonas sp. SYSU 1G8 TaxID=3133967 RepID=UPI0031FEB844
MSTTQDLPQRLAPLTGATNFRDLGGYEAADGRTVKWRHLYRSNSLAALTDEDLEHVGGLNIRLICDLRRDEECTEAPTRLPKVNAPEILQLAIGPERKDSKLYEYLASGDATESQMRAVMQDIYREFAIKFAPQYAEFMRRVARADQLPLLFHCAAGKDRTGFAAALILETLGVSRETILEDYALTNQYLKRNVAERFPHLKSPELFHTMMAANPDYLLASYAAVDDAYGSFDGYLTDGLGVSAKTREELRGLLLE